MNLFRCVPLSLALLSCPAGLFAHPLDVYLQATLVTVEPGEIRLHINLSPGVEVAERVLAMIDRNHDGLISSNESAVYAELLKHDLVARLDQRGVELKLDALNFPQPAELRTGWGIIQLEYSVTPGALAAGLHKFTLENRHQPVASAYLFNAEQPGSSSIQISGQKRTENQSTGEITFSFHPLSRPFTTVGIIVSLAALFVVFVGGVWRTKKERNAAPQGPFTAALSQ